MQDADDDYMPYSSLYSYYVVALLFLAFVLSFLDRIILSLVLDMVRQDLKLSDAEISLLAGLAFAIFYTLFALPFGRYVDTRGRRDLIAIGVALWSLATMACGLANGFWKLFISRMTVGVGEATLSPAAFSIIPDYFPPKKRGFATALYAAGPTVGGGLAVLIGAFIVQWAIETRPVLPFLGQLAPWKFTFIAVGVPGLLLALLMWFTIREPKRRLESKQDSGEAPSIGEVFRYLSTHWKLFTLVFLGYAGVVANSYAFNVWGPVYFLRIHGIDHHAVGIVFGAGHAIGGTLGVLLGGKLCDYWAANGKADATVRVTTFCACIQSPFFITCYLSTDALIAQATIVLGMTTSAIYGGMQGAMVQALAPSRMRGQVAGLYLMTANLVGLGLAPFLTGLMTDQIFGGPMGIGRSLATTSIISLSIGFILLVSSLKLVRARVTALQSS